MKSNNFLIIVILFILAASFLIGGLTICDSNFKSISLNISSSAFVVLLVEIASLIRDRCSQSFLAGDYKRTRITQEKENSGDTKYVDMTGYYDDERVNPRFKLKYIADGRYSANVFYHSSEALITLKLDQSNKMIGTGSYQYLNGRDLGSYDFQVDKDKNKIYIFYSNLLPSGTARGYEVWEKA